MSIKTGQPFVSVIMPTYNHAKIIGKAIESVLNQTYKNFELIIIDNYSEDDTEKIVASYSDDRIIYLKFRNNGIIAASRNAGIKHSHGEWISFLDSDDYWEKEKLQAVHSAIKKNPGAILVSHCERVINNGVIARRLTNFKKCDDIYKELLFRGNFLSTSATSVKRNILFKAGLFDTRENYRAVEDYDLWLRIAKLREGKFVHVDKVLGYYVIHSDCVSKSIETVGGNRKHVLISHIQTLDKNQYNINWLLKKYTSNVEFAQGRQFQLNGNFNKAIHHTLGSIFLYPFELKRWAVLILSVLKIRK